MSNTTTYKQTAIGLIPEDWEVERFDNVFELLSTNSFSRDNLTYEETESKIQNIHYGDIHSKFKNEMLDCDTEMLPYVKDELVVNQKLNYLKEGDLIISDASEDYDGVGECIEVKNIATKKIVAGLHTFLARDKSNKTVKGFRTYIFKNQKVNIELKKIVTGTSVFSISKSELQKFKIPVPSILEQQKIASILATWDNAIDNCNDIIEELKVRNKGLAQQLLTGKMRVNGFQGNKWETLKLEKLGNVISGLTYSPDDVCDKEGVLVLRSSNIQDKKIDLKSTIYVKNAKFNPVLEDDILICVRNGSRNLIGKNLLIPKELEGVAFGAFMCVFRSEYNPYLIHLFDSEFYYREIQKNLGATINSINGSDLKKFKFPIPKLEEQKAIANILDKAIEELNQYQQKLETLQIQKKGLMQQLLTGKTRVRI